MATTVEELAFSRRGRGKRCCKLCGVTRQVTTATPPDSLSKLDISPPAGAPTSRTLQRSRDRKLSGSACSELRSRNSQSTISVNTGKFLSCENRDGIVIAVLGTLEGNTAGLRLCALCSICDAFLSCCSVLFRG